MPFSAPFPLLTYPVDFGLETPIEMGSDFGGNCWTEDLVAGKAVVIEEIVGSPSFDLVS